MQVVLGAAPTRAVAAPSDRGALWPRAASAARRHGNRGRMHQRQAAGDRSLGAHRLEGSTERAPTGVVERSVELARSPDASFG